jgi:hypothetical protein
MDLKQGGEKGWYIVDLHVHTPSSKDYKGEKNKEEYKNIILKANLKYKKTDEKRDDSLQIKMIAITDHNTTDGFKTIMGMKKETSELIKALKERNPDLEYIKTLQEEEALFNSVHILMGVEIKPYPGIHLLVIFHEEVQPDAVDSFLKDALGQEYEEKKGNPDQIIGWRIDQTLDELRNRFGNRAFAIAPHVDSTGGLYEGLKELKQPRISAFKHPVLRAVSFNNVETRERIKQLLGTPDYKRGTPLSFIQSSDFHGQPGYSIGFLHSKLFFDEKRLKYNSLFEALGNEKYVRCSADFVQDTYNSLIHGFSIQSFSSCTPEKLIFHENDHRVLCDTVCAYLNTDGGIIEISGNIPISEDKGEIIKEFQNNMNDILMSRLKPLRRRYQVKTLQMSSTKYKALVLFEQSSGLFMSDGRILILKNDNPCPAEPHDIEYIVARNLNKRFGKSLGRKLQDLSYETKRASKSQQSYPLVVKFSDKFNFSFTRHFEFTLLDEIHDNIEELQEKATKYYVGHN